MIGISLEAKKAIEDGEDEFVCSSGGGAIVFRKSLDAGFYVECERPGTRTVDGRVFPGEFFEGYIGCIDARGLGYWLIEKVKGYRDGT